MQQLCKEGAIEGSFKEGKSWMIPEDSILEEKASYNVNRRAGRKDKKPLPIGVSSYIEAVERYYYVDKTLMIKDFIDTLPKVSLFTRPRRFGKTLNMDMLRVYFEKREEDNSVYFKDKAIWKCGTKYQEYQGKFPVICLSFKDVKYNGWENALKDISELIRYEYLRHEELFRSDACSSAEKEFYSKIANGSMDEVELAHSLSYLSVMLHKHYGKETIIIIDEYDTPIHQGFINGYYDEAVSFIRKLFSGAFKDNKSLAYGFLTGILRVAKESIFSGMNNLKVNTIMEDRFSSYFGFTRQEVHDMLKYYNMQDKMTEVREWYDGYRFGISEIYNPWSVINYVDERCVAKAFWLSTGSNDVIGDIISAASTDILEKLRRLLQGESVVTYVDVGVIYPEISNNPSSIFSFLLVTGYLRNDEISPQADGSYMCRVKIPNKEISLVYTREIISKIKGDQGEPVALQIAQAIFERNISKLSDAINRYLTQTISCYDTSSEAFYQGLLIGFCAMLSHKYIIRSNREAGLGRFDIEMKPMVSELPAYIFELKNSKNSKESLDKLAEKALEQICDKKYDTDLKAEGVKDIIRIGIAFRNKEAAMKIL